MRPLTMPSTLCLGSVAFATPNLAHDDRCAAVSASVAEAEFDDRVSMTCAGRHAIVVGQALVVVKPS